MRVLLAPDSFKGSLTSLQAAEAMAEGIKRVMPEWECVKVPMADGGEGTVEALVYTTGGEIIPCQVTGPLGKPVQSFFGLLGDGTTGVIEMAAASGLLLVPPAQRNPMLTTTYGTGELIREAVKRGCRRLIIGIGGSATNDGGVGMAQALGYQFLDCSQKEIGFGGGNLKNIQSIKGDKVRGLLKDIEILVACDVDNPLCGKLGASHVFGPQKGATPDMVRHLDEGLEHLAGLIYKEMGVDISNLPGAGAAGGLGGGLVAFTGASLASGIEIISEAINLQKLIEQADLIITGEGRIDVQTSYGKTPVGIGRIAKTIGRPVLCIGGSVGSGAQKVYAQGIDALFSIMEEPVELEAAMANAAALLTRTTERVTRLLKLGMAIKEC